MLRKNDNQKVPTCQPSGPNLKSHGFTGNSSNPRENGFTVSNLQPSTTSTTTTVTVVQVADVSTSTTTTVSTETDTSATIVLQLPLQ
jgi:hypothetical protein